MGFCIWLICGISVSPSYTIKGGVLKIHDVMPRTINLVNASVEMYSSCSDAKGGGASSGIVMYKNVKKGRGMLDSGNSFYFILI